MRSIFCVSSEARGIAITHEINTCETPSASSPHAMHTLAVPDMLTGRTNARYAISVRITQALGGASLSHDGVKLAVYFVIVVEAYDADTLKKG